MVKPIEEGVHYIRVRGTKLGEKFKIANCPYVLGRGHETFDLVEARRNADLIAAAPELYEALNAIVHHSVSGIHMNKLFEKGRAALAKARGEA